MTELPDPGAADLAPRLADALTRTLLARAVEQAGGSAALLQPLLLPRVRLDTDGPTPLLVAIAEDGAPQPVADLLAAAKADPALALAFQAPRGQGGTGLSPAGHGLGPADRRSRMSDADKAAFIRRHGPAAFLRLPD